MKKKYLVYLMLTCLVLPFNSCYKVEEGVFVAKVETEDSEIWIYEEPGPGVSLGYVIATVDSGALVYEMSEQEFERAIKIDSLTGEIFTDQGHYFDYERNKSITAKVVVSSIDFGVTKEATIVVNLYDATFDKELKRQGLTEYKIKEQPLKNKLIGYIEGYSLYGTLSYSFQSQSNPNAMRVDSRNGALYVQDSSFYDYEINKVISGDVRISNGFVYEDFNVKVNILEK